ncbi:hypothetical protein KCP76_18700 [Salmonella enterica subsp. enterica serovar Weltevreden]|nr:hypothetical protein KCP76_18700 [Salmonella enterica subsp. enterica serovar Weltevreden]
MKSPALRARWQEAVCGVDLKSLFGRKNNVVQSKLIRAAVRKTTFTVITAARSLRTLRNIRATNGHGCGLGTEPERSVIIFGLRGCSAARLHRADIQQRSVCHVPGRVPSRGFVTGIGTVCGLTGYER